MKEKTIKTEFASAYRSTKDEIICQNKLASGVQLLQSTIDWMPDIFLVLNKNRQIVLANQAAVQLFEAKDKDSLLGLRPGEAVDCENATKSKGGCGTTLFCSTCGAVKAILSGLRGEEDIQECRLTQKNGNALDLRAFSFNTSFDGENFCIFILFDISQEKRKDALQRIFFHDIMNTLGALRVFSELFSEIKNPQEAEDVRSSIYGLCNRVIDEVDAQRDLIKAENRELSINLSSVDSSELLSDIKKVYEKHDIAIGRNIVINPSAEEIKFLSDSTLLRRVLGNMVKNALEASSEGDTVTVGCNRVGEEIQFSVHNPGFMPREVQLQVFKR